MVNEATAAAAGRTTGVLAAALDEVSAAAADLFNAFAQDCQAVIKQAAVFHDEFAAMLSASGAAYTGAEASNALAAATDVTLAMGGSGNPIPPLSYLTNVVDHYITPLYPGFTLANARALFTPEAFYPLTGIKDLIPNISVSEGLTILDNSIRQELAAGNNVAVLGFSQSSIIASLEMALLNPSGTPSSLPVVFTLLGNPMNPNGGLLARFPGLTMPSLGFTFYGATPANSFTTNIYTIEYDGFSDFPQYPINVLADLNAIAGIYYVHGTYADLTPAQIATAIPLTNTVGPTMTSYHMIPNPRLPILEPLRAVPVVGPAFADLLEPNTRVLVNLGYGSIDNGWSPDPPNLPTSFGLLPNVNPIDVAQALVAGTEKGVNAFIGHLPSIASNFSLTGLESAIAAVPQPSLNPVVHLLTEPGEVVNSLTSAVATGYSVLLPTADFVTAAALSIPAYDAQLFANGIAQFLGGDPVGLVRAIGDPIAADAALFSVAAGFQTIVLVSAAQSILADLGSI